MLAGSPPSGPRTVRTPTRSPQVCSWSAAAARNVSAAPSTTCLSSATSTRASLPIVVVLPVPFTPDHQDDGRLRVLAAHLERAVQRRVDQVDQLLAEDLPGLVGRSTPSTRIRVRSFSTSSCVGATPTSAVISVVSMSSHVSSSSLSRDSSASRPLPSEPCDRASRARSRTRRPCADSGFSIVGAAALGQLGVLQRPGRRVPRFLGVLADLRLRGVERRRLGGRRQLGLPPPGDDESSGTGDHDDRDHHDDGDQGLVGEQSDELWGQHGSPS